MAIVTLRYPVVSPRIINCSGARLGRTRPDWPAGNALWQLFPARLAPIVLEPTLLRSRYVRTPPYRSIRIGILIESESKAVANLSNDSKESSRVRWIRAKHLDNQRGHLRTKHRRSSLQQGAGIESFVVYEMLFESSNTVEKRTRFEKSYRRGKYDTRKSYFFNQTVLTPFPRKIHRVPILMDGCVRK